MKKTVNLRDSDYNWKAFQYEGDIKESLTKELNIRRISIGNYASIARTAATSYLKQYGFRLVDNV